MMHVLHIGKTGGKALYVALAPLLARGDLVMHGHDVRLSDVPVGDKAVFIVRDPVSRFISGFNSRLRRGRPRNDIDWSAEERAAFARFPLPSRLAAALGSEDVEERKAAAEAINGIYHTARHLSHWLHDPDYVARRRDDILFIACTRSLNQDFGVLARLLDAPEGTQLPSDALGKHATPDGFETSLDDRGTQAVTQWYRDDFRLYDLCLEIRETIIRRAADQHLAAP